jgi:hypothetical protein
MRQTLGRSSLVVTVVVVATVVAAGGGLGVAAERLGIVSAEGAWRGLRAAQVLFAAPPSIESLGYDLPPLPTLLQLPFAVLPPLRFSTLPGSLVASAAVALAAWSLWSTLRRLGRGRWIAAAATSMLVLHPVTLYAVATGSGDVLAVALLLLALRLWLGWLWTGSLVPLVAAAFALGFGCLARYELIWVGMGLTGGVALLAGRHHATREPAGAVSQPGARLALAIAFGTPVGFAVGLWLLLTALATGNPFSFVAAAPAVAAMTGPSGGPSGASPMWQSERELAAFLHTLSRGRDVLVDDRRVYLPVFFARRPDMFIATADPDYRSVLSNPRGRAALILVRTPAETGIPDPINEAWPTLFEGRVPWAELVGESLVTGDGRGHYRLFRVRGSDRAAQIQEVQL